MTSSTTINLFLPDTLATERVGKIIAHCLKPGMVVTLSGELGSGKTSLVRAMLYGLDVNGPIKSPTYTLVEQYQVLNLYLYHFDFYRITHPEELEDIGFRECLRSDAICFIEWPELAGARLPEADLALSLAIDDGGRTLTVSTRHAEVYRCLCSSLAPLHLRPSATEGRGADSATQ